MLKSSSINDIANRVSNKVIARLNYVMIGSKVEAITKEADVELSNLFYLMYQQIDDIKKDNSLDENEKINKIYSTISESNDKSDSIVKKRDELIAIARKNQWPDLYKIRFVYLELAKYLEKNTDFFLNDKLDKLGLSQEEIKAIYDNNYVGISDLKKRNEVYQVICKSAAYFLKNTLDKLNIKCSYINTISSNPDDLKHWWLVAQDEKQQQYFLTLAPDLALIKNNFPTEHFANDIPLFSENGELYYDADSVEDFIQTCKFSQSFKYLNKTLTAKGVSHEILSQDEIEKIDRAIGYSSLYELTDNRISVAKFDKMYMDLLIDNSPVFKIYRNYFGFLPNMYDIDFYIEDVNRDPNKPEYIYSLFRDSNDISKKDYYSFKYNLEKYILTYLKSKNLISDDCTLDNFKSTIVSKFYNDAGVSETDLLATLKNNKKDIEKMRKTNSKDYELLDLILHLLIVENSFESYFVFKDLFEKQKKEYEITSSSENEEKLKELEGKYNDCRKSLRIKALYPHLNFIGYYTSVKDKLNIDYSKFVPQEVLVEKFQLMFPRLFDFNFEGEYGYNRALRSTNFSLQDYSEQIVIIKRMINKIFHELTYENSGNVKGYNSKFFPAENRINTYPAKDRVTGEYCIVFSFRPAENEGTCEFIYIPSLNLLRTRNFIADRDRYFVVSTRYQAELDEIENANARNIENNNRKSK